MAFRKKVEFKNHEPKFPAPLEGYAATVELPEGHHVTIGELTPGTIVEVATWNGTGKPDETTKRFLISADGTGLSRRTGQSSEEIENKPAKQITNSIYESSPFVNTQAIADPIFGNQYFNNRSSSSQFEESDQGSSKSSMFMKVAATFLIPVVLVSSFAAAIKFGGIGVTVPTIGANSFFGSSTNSVIFYKKNSDVKAGTAVIAKENNVVLLGSYGGDIGNLSLFTINGKQMSVSKQSLSGQSLLLIPYLGTVLKPILS